MNKDILNGVPTWLIIKQDIELKIIQGDYAAGERIPPVREIAKIYDIGTSTASKILEKLCVEGTIYRKRGIGYFVKPYEKDNLCVKHKKNLEKSIINLFEYADVIGIDPMEIINKIDKLRNQKK